MKRRKFITLLGGAAAWPLAARAQLPATPVIGFLGAVSPDGFTERVRAFRQGLKEAGFVEGENVAIVYRWTEGQLDLLPALAAELVRRRVSVIASFSPAAALAAKAATTTIPIVFLVSVDPVELGLVATRFAVFLTPSAPWHRSFLQAAKDAGAKLGIQVHSALVQTVEDLDEAFAMALRERVDGIFVQPTSLSRSYRVPMAELALKHRLPSMFGGREYVEAGGLMSYAAGYVDLTRRAATYIDKILKGGKPADLPVELASKYLLVINVTTAKKL